MESGKARSPATVFLGIPDSTPIVNAAKLQVGESQGYGDNRRDQRDAYRLL